MLLLIHITSALASVAYTIYLLARPSRRKSYLHFGLIAATVATGTYLVLSLHTAMLHTCLTGLAYVLSVTVGTLIARRRLLAVA